MGQIPLREEQTIYIGGFTIPLNAREPRKKYRQIDYSTPDKAKLTLSRDKKVLYSMTLKPVKGHRMGAEIRRTEKNEDKTSFGVISKWGDRLEVCSYKNQSKTAKAWRGNPKLAKKLGIPKANPKSFHIFLNGEYITLDIDDWRKLYRIFNKVGHFYGILGRKKAKKGRKK